MKQFRADLHIHSRFSRATSKKLTPRHLAAWAEVKGLDVIGTGDLTHPEWLDELEDQLVEDSQSGLFRLKDATDLGKEIPRFGDYSMHGRSLFMLQGEISSIYKRGGKVRKVHNLVYMPTFEAARRFSNRLGEIGNITSDGRPILGMDSRDILDLVLETHPLAFLIPAHIWTPWFSLFGSKSGFDTIEECYGDYASEIFALETGLSSDPEMNWLWSALDRFALVSNSDAHSGDKLGRECNLFAGDISYEGMYRSLRGEGLGHKFLGTMEFFPEEGKYHLDGHRKCNVVMEPRETLTRDGVCPVCGKPLTVGVLHRILSLADRDIPKQPSKAGDFSSLIPLPELMSEVLGVGPKAKKVMDLYSETIRKLGSEMAILRDVPEEDIKKIHPVLAEAVSRMRKGEVLRQPGFDGEYGVVRVFSQKERNEFKHGKMLIDVPEKVSGLTSEEEASITPRFETAVQQRKDEPESITYNDAQQKAIKFAPDPVLVMAGPGTGKTRTLIGRIEYLLGSGVKARQILALTFTRRAAQELTTRLADSIQNKLSIPRADTLHGLAFEYWQNSNSDAPTLLSEESSKRVFAEANAEISKQQCKKAWEAISLCRERMEPCSVEMQDAFSNYSSLKNSWNLADYTDLLEFWLESLRNNVFVHPWIHVLVDEIQDLSPLQLAVVRELVSQDKQNGQGFFGIGDPDQSIYGFRGAHGGVKSYLEKELSSLNTIQLFENYRSSQHIVDYASALMQPVREAKAIEAKRSLEAEVRMFEAPTSEAEASWIGEQVRGLLGQTSHSLQDGRQERLLGGELSPGDIAVLVRFKALIPVISQTLNRLGIPCAVPEQEAFWVDPRVELILAAAGRFVGISSKEGEEQIPCPDVVLAKGPEGIAVYLEDIPPFDRLFWKSSAFKQLLKHYKEHNGWAGLLNWINLQTELDQVRQKSEKVQIMSMHASKGLEFKAVFLPALEDGIMPYSGMNTLTGTASSISDHYDIDEERRLLYVAITRAEQLLFLSHSSKRMIYGHTVHLAPSRFLVDLPAEGLMHSALKAKKKHTETQLSLI
ncbi:UvrD-helicase domain-containing protein [Halodesulfovibrio marinisediminis]|uniref:TIGR00375 family protein n=1 Tax=Halodesulfovibrio marinisediminis DSM 17456 TaxID=1121457 RepID=A0A1N6EY21_9BACT|nr:UvrD-helicase domain-containing protein [Halodesulfovibrio marinisediminis]SIN87853.1 TIGR00375 family protein [Halodesulfovibrio marinisediminis DSM 17456]